MSNRAWGAAWVVALGLSACAGAGLQPDAGGPKEPGVLADAGTLPDSSCFDVPDPNPNESRFDDGGTPVDTRVVFAPAKPPPALSGGTLAVMANGTIVAADPDRDRVWLLGPTATMPRSVALAPGDEPGRVVEGPIGRAFVALRGSGQVAEIDVRLGLVMGRHAACAAPRGLAWSAMRSELLVACATGTLARLVFDPKPTGLELERQTLQHPAEDLRDVVVLADGNTLVSTFRSAQVLSVAPDGTASPLPHTLLIESAQVAWRMVGQSDRALVLVQTNRPPSDAGVCDSTAVSTYGGGGPFGLSPLIHSRLSVATQATHDALTQDLLPPLSVDIAVSPLGRIAIAGAGTNTLELRGSPQSLVLKVPGEVTSVAFREEDAVVFSREPARLFVYSGNELAKTVELGGASVLSTAHALFHRTTRAGIACASCHPEGGDDGKIWPLPEGARRTNSLRGGLKASAPFHWQGDRLTMRELLADVMVRRMDAELPHPAAVTAMLDWIDALPALPAADGLDPAAIARGKTLFEAPARGCLTCHSGPLGTNNANADVGTGGTFQVPRLVDLAARAPYFHDGSVATIEARFAAKGDLHGNTSTLTAAERADLSTYLRSR